MSCTHRSGRWVSGGTCDWTGDPLPDVWEEYSTFEDTGIGSFRCTQCGEVGYYTGHWKRYHEDGIPCFGSENVPRIQN